MCIYAYICKTNSLEMSFQHMLLEPLDVHNAKNMNVNPFLTPYIRMNSKQITEPNARSKTIKLPGQNLCDLGLSKDF